MNLLYISNVLGDRGFTPGIAENLSEKFSEFATVTIVSDKKNQIMRLFEMIYTIYNKYRNLDLVLIDTFSGKSYYFAILSSYVCHFLNLRYILVLRGGNLKNEFLRKKIISKKILFNSYQIISPSVFFERSLSRMQIKTTYIPNYIDIEDYRFEHRKKCTPKLLWVRSFHKVYNPEMAIYVTYELNKIYPNVELCMVGPEKDGMLEKCKRLSNRLNISKNIQFTGLLKKKDWISLSYNYDIFLNTTDYDNLPVSVIEVMALGIPIVSTNAGGLKYLHNQESDGLLVEKNDIQMMKNNVVRLIENKKLAQALSFNGRQKAKKFRWEKVKDLWNKVFESIE